MSCTCCPRPQALFADLEKGLARANDVIRLNNSFVFRIKTEQTNQKKQNNKNKNKKLNDKESKERQRFPFNILLILQCDSKILTFSCHFNLGQLMLKIGASMCGYLIRRLDRRQSKYIFEITRIPIAYAAVSYLNI